MTQCESMASKQGGGGPQGMLPSYGRCSRKAKIGSLCTQHDQVRRREAARKARRHEAVHAWEAARKARRQDVPDVAVAAPAKPKTKTPAKPKTKAPKPKPTPTEPTPKPRSLTGKIAERVTSTAGLITEIERLVKWALADLCSLGEAEEIDPDRLRIVCTLEPPKNSAGTSKSDRDTLGHFTQYDCWESSDGLKYRAININPFLLTHFSAADLARTCYHEAIHAWDDWRGVRDAASNGRHNAKFAAACGASGVLECERVQDSRGYITPGFTPRGLEMLEQIEPKAPSHFRIAQPAKAKKPTAKRVTLECDGCGMKAGVPIGKYTEQLARLSKDVTDMMLSQADGTQPAVMRCMACDQGMFPPQDFMV